MFGVQSRRFASKLQQTAGRPIPHSPGLPLLGTALAIGRAGGAPRLHEYVDARHKQLGPIFRENMGTTEAVFVAEPALIRQVFAREGKFPRHFVPKAWELYNELHHCQRGLFFMEGPEWYQHRKTMNKHFLAPRAVENLKGLHDRLVARFVRRWKKFDGSVVANAEHEFYRHSISFVLGSLIGDNYETNHEKYSAHVDELATTFHRIFETSSALNVLPNVRIVQLLRLPLWKRFETAVSTSIESSRRVVLMALSDLSENGLLYQLVREKIPEETVRAIVADLLIAAGDATAFTSQWALYLLGKDEQVQERALAQPSLVSGIVKETLRLYPSAPFIARILPEETIIDGYVVKKNEMVLISLYTVGRDDRLYPLADSFQPERWLKKSGKSSEFVGVNDNNGFVPFALGSRSCVGARLARAQLNATIQQIVANYRITTLEEVETILRLVPVPSKPLKIKIESR